MSKGKIFKFKNSVERQEYEKDKEIKKFLNYQDFNCFIDLICKNCNNVLPIVNFIGNNMFEVNKDSYSFETDLVLLEKNNDGSSNLINIEFTEKKQFINSIYRDFEFNEDYFLKKQKGSIT